MRYGINNVVGGFGRPMQAEEAIPYAIARTLIEHKQIREILYPYGRFKRAVELGCGYGRNLPVLLEHADRVVGVERDDQLSAVARDLNPHAVVQCAPIDDYEEVLVPSAYDLVLTFTFLQHLDNTDLKKAIATIGRVTVKGAVVILCEETDPVKSQVGCLSWGPEQYGAMLKQVGGFEFDFARDRVIEPTFPGGVSGKFMVYRRQS